MTDKTLTDILAETKAIVEAATPGPWLLSMSNQVVRILDPEPKAIAKFVEDDIPNAQFIAHARSMMPALIEALELAVEQRQYLEELFLVRLDLRKARDQALADIILRKAGDR